MRFDLIKSRPEGRDYLLPPSKPQLPCDLIFEDGWLAEPEGHSHALHFDRSDFDTEAAWTALLTVYPLHRLDLAYYSARHSDLPPGPMLLALGLRKNYQSLAEWREAGLLSHRGRGLGVLYDLPLATIRLYDRFGEADQNTWDQLWQKRRVKKNLVREMIHDFYDLGPVDRQECLAEVQAFEESWAARSAPFPAETLRDLVRARRFPELTALGQRVKEKIRELKLPPGIHIPLPADLEATSLEIRFSFSSARELEGLLATLQPDQCQKLEEILALL
ncbi:MAG: hypothetical protein HS115_05615 [Spirochaetales bacterium]|nr:hypothetical protein [Spirochaetales bacterium]